MWFAREFEVRVKLLVGSDADLYAQARETCNSDDDSDDSGNVQAEWNHSTKTRCGPYLQGKNWLKSDGCHVDRGSNTKDYFY